MKETVVPQAEARKRRFETFRSLRHPYFRPFWIGTLFSFTGMQMQNVAQGRLVYQQKGVLVYGGNDSKSDD